MQEFFQQLLVNLRQTTFLEAIAVISGIVSVWFSRKENIWVYPTGLVGTIIYIYLSFKLDLIGEATVNFYYTVMSVYGWWMWARRSSSLQPLVKIRFSNKKEWVQEIIFFISFFVTLFFLISYLKKAFPGAIPLPDSFAAASAFTGMWLMARKKVESWWWWIITNITSIPLYYVKGLAFTSIYYFVLLIMAIAGLLAWMRKAKTYNAENQFEFER